MSATYVHSIRQDPIKRLRHHRQVPQVLHNLQCRRVHIEIIGHVKVERQPWKSPETVHIVTERAQNHHLLMQEPFLPIKDQIFLSLFPNKRDFIIWAYDDWVEGSPPTVFLHGVLGALLLRTEDSRSRREESFVFRGRVDAQIYRERWVFTANRHD